jgi:hypothetical protein
MAWKKLGLVFAASGQADWMQTHAYVPTCIVQDEKSLRVYVAFLDKDKVGRIGFVDVDVADPRRVLGVSERPALDIGAPGSFDDSGVTPSCVLDHGSLRLLYYNGWQRSSRVPYHIFTGLAASRDGGTSFERLSEIPILDRTGFGLLVRSTPYVLPPARPGDVWRIWYNAGRDAIQRPEGWVPTYGLRAAESADGRSWNVEDRPILNPVRPEEYGIARPWVRRIPEGWEMLVSFRSLSLKYRIGRARSRDNVTWTRCGSDGLPTVSETGWDSEMIAFPCVVATIYGNYLFYNGNGYGRTGFGVAVDAPGADW